MNPKQALDQSLKYLAKAPRSQGQVEGFLATKGWDESTVQATIAELTNLGYLGDAALANDHAAKLFAKGLGREKVASDLATKGFGQAEIDDALASATESDEVAFALTLLAKRKATPSDLAKSARYLYSRGYSQEVVERAIEAAFPPDYD